MNVKIIIEHLEPVVGKWIILEYLNASRIIGKEKVLVTNFCPSKDLVTKLKDYLDSFEWTCDSVLSMYNPRELIILDPQAEEPLKPSDSLLAKAVVIGGILGDHPPKGRTKVLLTSKMKGSITRNIGDGQYSIDGAAYVADLVLNKSLSLDDIPYIDGFRITSNMGGIVHEIVLPYRYPILPDGRPLLSKELLTYVKNRIVYDEHGLMKGKTNNHI